MIVGKQFTVFLPFLWGWGKKVVLTLYGKLALFWKGYFAQGSKQFISLDKVALLKTGNHKSCPYAGILLLVRVLTSMVDIVCFDI